MLASQPNNVSCPARVFTGKSDDADFVYKSIGEGKLKWFKDDLTTIMFWKFLSSSKFSKVSGRVQDCI